ncbi:hypothetical protein HHK36_000559 [Tetracentron sinense]|uniref:glutathione transferase n=1 Tax=Tetracentron sinense TaxID=13715 RepID=A0A834ZVQ3_TETSI|nr:hypothetical protein HHK36_000559 [Tetracentron sinense]
MWEGMVPRRCVLIVRMLLPYHVVADYETEEDDRILDSDTTGQMSSRSQQWDHNISAKVSEFTATFEKQILAFNIISRKRALGEFRSEEKLMIEQALLQEEKQTIMELSAEIESREKAGREAAEAKMRMAAMVQAEQARAEALAHTEMISRAPMRGNAFGTQGNGGSVGHDMARQEQGVNPDEIIHGWRNTQRDNEEPSEEFLNDENETENGETGMQDEWREVGEFDLNTRVQWALKLKGIEYEYVEEDLSNKSPLLLMLNPIHKKVPVLLHAGKSISESLVILEYIDDTWKQNPILPEDPFERAKARFWAKFEEEKFIEAIRHALLSEGEQQEKEVKQAIEALEILEGELKSKEKFFGGEKIGFVDIVLGWVTVWLGVVEEVAGIKVFDSHKFPSFNKWMENFVETPIIKDKLPSRDKLVLQFHKIRQSKRFTHK